MSFLVEIRDPPAPFKVLRGKPSVDNLTDSALTRLNLDPPTLWSEPLGLGGTASWERPKRPPPLIALGARVASCLATHDQLYMRQRLATLIFKPEAEPKRERVRVTDLSPERLSKMWAREQGE